MLLYGKVCNQTVLYLFEYSRVMRRQKVRCGSNGSRFPGKANTTADGDARASSGKLIIIFLLLFSFSF